MHAGENVRTVLFVVGDIALLHAGKLRYDLELVFRLADLDMRPLGTRPGRHPEIVQEIIENAIHFPMQRQERASALRVAIDLDATALAPRYEAPDVHSFPYLLWLGSVGGCIETSRQISMGIAAVGNFRQPADPETRARAGGLSTVSDP